MSFVFCQPNVFVIQIFLINGNWQGEVGSWLRLSAATPSRITRLKLSLHFLLSTLTTAATDSALRAADE